MFHLSRCVLQGICANTRGISISQSRGTIVVERWWQVPLAPKEQEPRLHRRHRVYRLVEDKKHSPKEKLELILTQTVERLGGRGDAVLVKKSLGRNKLLPQGLAVYASPENKMKFEEERRLLHEGKVEDRVQTRTGQLTVEYLKRCHLEVGVKSDIAWELDKELVCRHFLRRLGVFVPPHALALPDKPITSLGEYWCEVTVNGISTVRIPVSVIEFETPTARRYRRRLEKQQQEAGMSNTVPSAEGTEK
ncbi:39S ribosomal protein L9, mitochondrial [Latimeria chalumnae]|uniref:Large ribosomal subunit protein bL9m n=1 Tax=Latimeria chalumnae TaxID=7897 RepID=H2ZZV0_LATCH|nr:PREDICTED: 39S ribosomal protein L9, mitochondrial [Latimeria chalumnae]|eukprot:XP_006013771.1 PREDICTED: 39S ribosomal protein L9, mitochondrial [Latimeria chalumnae]